MVGCRWLRRDHENARRGRVGAEVSAADWRSVNAVVVARVGRHGMRKSARGRGERERLRVAEVSLRRFLQFVRCVALRAAVPRDLIARRRGSCGRNGHRRHARTALRGHRHRVAVGASAFVRDSDPEVGRADVVDDAREDRTGGAADRIRWVTRGRAEPLIRRGAGRDDGDREGLARGQRYVRRLRDDYRRRTLRNGQRGHAAVGGATVRSANPVARRRGNRTGEKDRAEVEILV